MIDLAERLLDRAGDFFLIALGGEALQRGEVVADRGERLVDLVDQRGDDMAEIADAREMREHCFHLAEPPLAHAALGGGRAGEPRVERSRLRQ